MIRIPDAGRFEVRLMDGSTNPYLLQAALIGAGLDGVENGRDPGERLDINMYEEEHKLEKVRKLPSDLIDSIRIFEKDDVAKATFGAEFVDAYAKLKNEEWRRFHSEVSAWERMHTLDC